MFHKIKIFIRDHIPTYVPLFCTARSKSPIFSLSFLSHQISLDHSKGWDMPTVQPGPSPVLTPTANRVGCEREVATSVLAANHNRGWSVPGTREQSEIPRATGVEYGARSCQGSMYQAESLIAPKALLAKLLLWNVTLPRILWSVENRVSSPCISSHVRLSTLE